MIAPRQTSLPDTRDGIHELGHRRFVGGDGAFWDAVGELQFRFLLDQGLAPEDILIDVGCGALRGGVRFIRYLEPGHYLGIDKHLELIIYGVSGELGLAEYRLRRPRLVISDCFEFHRFEERPTFGIAQSLFTHLAPRDVEHCLRMLRLSAAPGCRFFASFFEVEEPLENPSDSHSHGHFLYTRSQMQDFGSLSGWTAHYVGAWNHPRNQMMMEYRAP